MWGTWNLSDRAWPGRKVAALNASLRDVRWLFAGLVVTLIVSVIVALASPSDEAVRRRRELDRERATETCVDGPSCATDR